MNKKYIKLQQEGSDWSFGSRWGDQMEIAITDWFGKSISRKECKILDAGCGEGRGLLALKKSGFKNITGVDLSEEKLIKAREHELDVVFADIQNLSLKDNSFDYCFSSHTLEHMLDLEKALSELMRVSKVLYYIVPIHETSEFVRMNNPSHVNPINHPREFIKHLDELNLRHRDTVHFRMCAELWGIVER